MSIVCGHFQQLHQLSVIPIFSPNQTVFLKIEFLFHEGSPYNGVQKCGRLSKNRLYIKLLNIYLFSIFTIKTPPALNLEDADKCTLTIT